MNKVTLLDGGMGQELLRRSANPPSPLWSAQVLMDEPEIVEAVHLDYIKVGAEVITLNAYSITPERLVENGDVTKFSALQAQAIAIAKSAVKKSGSEAVIAGCLPPMITSYQPELAPDIDACIATYREIAAEQKDHVDVFLCETLGSIREARAATIAAVETGIPVWTSMTVKDGEGTTLRSGEPLEEAIEAVKEAGAYAVLVNCSWPESLTQSIPLLKNSSLPFGAYANGFTSVDPLKSSATVAVLKARTDLGPTAYADHVMGWVESGATIVGGCCETGPEHIAEIAKRLAQLNNQNSGVL